MPRLRLDLLAQIRAAGLPPPETEWRFHPERKWRWDFCYPDPGLMLAFEVQGGLWSRGRHSRARGYVQDCFKMAEGVLLGWRVFWFPTDWLADGTALAYVERALKGG